MSIDRSDGPDQRLFAVARRQFGVFTSTQFVACGFARATLDARCRAGTYVRAHCGVYRHAVMAPSWQSRALAALLAVGGTTTLARSSAAQVLGLDLPNLRDDHIHLLVHQRTWGQLDGVVVHRSKAFEADVIIHEGWPVTNATRTLFDLGTTIGPQAMRRAVAHAVRNNLTDASLIREAATRLGRIKGKRWLLALADELHPLDSNCRSHIETLFLHIMRKAGRPPTAMNHPVVDAFGHRRFIDAVYLPEQLPIELDSRQHHGSLLDWHDDTRRENAIVLVDWRDFLRFSRDDLIHHPAKVVESVFRALAASRRSR